MTPPLPDPAQTHAKLHKELDIFFIVLGLLLAIPAYFILGGISGDPPPLWGFPRHLAIGIPLVVLSVLHLLTGALLAVTGQWLFAVAGAVSSTLTALFFFAFMFSATGTVPISPISMVIVVIPIVVWSRVSKFLSAASAAK